MRRWSRGDRIVRQEVWSGQPWLLGNQIVIEDSDDELVAYTYPGSALTYPDGDWPTPNRRHPWWPRPSWTSNGTLHVLRPGEPWAVWHFWDGSSYEFQGWYINIQRQFERFDSGYATQDLDLDIVVAPDETWTLKDWDVLPEKVADGKFTQSEADEIQAIGDALVARLHRGERLLDPKWRDWRPDRDWVATLEYSK